MDRTRSPIRTGPTIFVAEDDVAALGLDSDDLVVATAAQHLHDVDALQVGERRLELGLDTPVDVAAAACLAGRVGAAALRRLRLRARGDQYVTCIGEVAHTVAHAAVV